MAVDRHEHNGTDSPQLFAGDLQRAPQTALTADTGDTAGATYTTTEQGMIANLQTRVNELEDKLQDLGLLS